MIKKLDKKIISDYSDFINSDGLNTSLSLDAKIRHNVSQIINPSPWRVLARVAFIVFIVGILNLFLCPQFGLSFMKNSGLHELFMQFGKYGCKFFCGAFFLGSGLFIASFMLSYDDLRVSRQNKFLQIVLLSSIFLVLFVAAGGAIYFTVAIFWLMGAIIGGFICLELGFYFRCLSASVLSKY